MHCLARRSAATTSLCITQISSKISKPKRFRRSSVRMLSPSPQRKSHCCLAIFYIAFAILFPYTLCTLARRNAATPSFGVAQISSKIPKPKRFRRSSVRIFPTLCRTAVRNCTPVSFSMSANRTVFQLCQYNVCEEKANMRSIRFYIRKPAPTRQNIFINQKHIYRLINLLGVYENYT